MTTLDIHDLIQSIIAQTTCRVVNQLYIFPYLFRLAFEEIDQTLNLFVVSRHCKNAVDQVTNTNSIQIQVPAGCERTQQIHTQVIYHTGMVYFFRF
jgi:hypothetical protein